jgi:hypothetical protein
VQEEQLVLDVSHAMHFGSQELHIFGFEEENVPVGQLTVHVIL